VENILNFKQLYNFAAQSIINACIYDDTETLAFYHDAGKNLDSISDFYGDGLLHTTIYYDSINSFHALLSWGLNIELPSTYDGATPLNAAAIVGDLNYISPLVDMGADVNTTDYFGFTPLLNSIFFEEYDATNYFLTLPNVDVNIACEYGVTPLIISYFDDNEQTMDAIILHPTFDPTYNTILFQDDTLTQHMNSLGVYADEDIIEAFHLTKLLAHRYDLDGTFSLENLDYTGNNFPYEGYSNDLSVAAFTQSYEYFLSNVVLTSIIPLWANNALASALDTLKFQDDNNNASLFCDRFFDGQSILIASGWDMHAVEIVMHQDRLYRCNRGDDSDGIHGIEEFIITTPNNLTPDIVNTMMQASGSLEFLQSDLIDILGLVKIGEIENPTQTVGNCAWTSLEAGLEALILTHLLAEGIAPEIAHNFAKQTFELWEEFDMTHSLEDFIDHSDALIGNEFYDNLLADIFHNLDASQNQADFEQQALIFNELQQTPELSDLYYDLVGQYLDCYYPHDNDDITHYMTDYITWCYDSYMGNTTADYSSYLLGKEYFEFIQSYNDLERNDEHFILSLEDIFTPIHPTILEVEHPPNGAMDNISFMPYYQEACSLSDETLDFIIV